MIRTLARTALALLAAASAPTGAQDVAAEAAPAVVPAPQAAIVVQRDTPIRLMVLNEVSTRSAKAGDKFVLRVDEAVVVDGVTVVPVGAKAWGEVVEAKPSGALGRSGKLEARLLYLEAAGERVPISGDRGNAGKGGGTQMTMGAVGFALMVPVAAPFALLAPGNNARLKAGDIFSAFIEQDMLFDPATRKLVAAPAPPAATASDAAPPAQ